VSRYKDIVFPDPWIAEALGGTLKSNGEEYEYDLYQLQCEYRVFWHDGSVAVPALFIHDRASIPKIVHSFITKDGPWQPGSTIHDWVFHNKGVPGVETFELANDLFFECMKAKGTDKLTRNLIYGFVNSDIGRSVWENDG